MKNRCIIILVFPQNVILYVPTEIPLDIELKNRTFKKDYVQFRSCFQRGCEAASKPVPLNKSYLTVTCSKSTINAMKQDVKSVLSLTIKTTSCT